MKQVVLSLLAASVVWSGNSRAIAEDWREPNPHWAAFHTPRTDGVARARIDVPPGYKLCSMAESYSSTLWFYVPLDKKLRCEDLPTNAEPEKMPDYVVIGPSPDTAMTYQTTADVVRDEPLYCHGMSYDRPNEKISNAPTSIESAGKTLAGLETTMCTREDVDKNRYTKAFLAYRASPDTVGHKYMMASNVHLEKKREADELLVKVVKLFKLRK